MKWIRRLEEIKRFAIPRCYSELLPSASSVELHIFSDASEAAFAGICYMRVQRNKQIDVSMIAGKTRVAPTKKTLSIPRLELQGFILGIRLARTIITELSQIRIDDIVHWTDSKTVLAWIASEHRRYSTFVEHRVGEALEYFDDFKHATYRYVPSKLNTADRATKWESDFDVSPSGEWLCGPSFLKRPCNNWPSSTSIVVPECKEELKTVYLHFTHDQSDRSVFDFSRYSSLRTLLRTARCLLRAVRIWKQKCTNGQSANVKEQGFSEECSSARNLVIRMAQLDSFEEEILDLKLNKCVKCDSSIFKLSPFIDENDQLLRVLGRISRASFVSYDTKFPIILKSDHPVTQLIIDEYHRKFAHQHLETCVNEIRKKYWITHLRSTVKRSCQRCQHCLNQRAKPREPLMGELPASRLEPYVPPFTYTGMDLFGPVEVTVGRRHEKRWVVIYTCLVVRAVHLEIVSSLSSDACIMAYRNFVNLRVRPKVIHCDNGTNFVGMCRELKAAWENLKKEREKLQNETVDHTKSYQTEFKFNPPTAAHMGGVWERLVRTVKSVLKVLLKERAPREETLRCFLIETMDIVNSRPLTYLPTNDIMEPALTPNSFLKLNTLDSSPPSYEEAVKYCGHKQWKFVQQLSNHFWKRWITQYLPELTRRSKWFTKAKPIVAGDIVMIVDPNAERNCWEKGKVIKTYPDKSGQVRFADIKTSSGIRPKRPTVKLAVLDVVN